jgi:hypothetical protein
LKGISGDGSKVFIFPQKEADRITEVFHLSAPAREQVMKEETEKPNVQP